MNAVLVSKLCSEKYIHELQLVPLQKALTLEKQVFKHLLVYQHVQILPPTPF